MKGRKTKKRGIIQRNLMQSGEIYNRIRKIIEAARGNIARVINTEMVAAYWQIGREIVGQEHRKGYLA